MKPGVRFHIRDRLEASEPAIGPGKIALLEAIRRDRLDHGRGQSARKCPIATRGSLSKKRTTVYGVFATRAPTRPNRIGLSVVRLLGRRGNVLDIGNVDMVDGTPIVDIKPYVPAFDSRQQCRIGWFDGKLARAPSLRADDRMR